MKIKIGNVEIANPCVLAPMAGVTDLPFRLLCKEQGVGLLSMEMVSAKAISFHNKNTLDLMQIAEGENPIALQIFGSDPEIMAAIAAQIEDGPYDEESKTGGRDRGEGFQGSKKAGDGKDPQRISGVQCQCRRDGKDS